jgi:serine/threonine protein kinase
MVGTLRLSNIIDLKCENIMIELETNKPIIIDLGLSEIVDENSDQTCREAGSFEYASTEKVEILKGYDSEKGKPFSGFKTDVWSLGIILFVVLYGHYPWKKEERKKMIKFEKKHPEVNFPDYLKQISAEAKDLIRKMLEVDFNKRIPLQEVLSHPWLQPPKLKPLPRISRKLSD